MDLGNEKNPEIEHRFNACSICTMYKRVSVHCGHVSAVLEIRATERPDRTSVYFEFPISSGD